MNTVNSQIPNAEKNLSKIKNQLSSVGFNPSEQQRLLNLAIAEAISNNVDLPGPERAGTLTIWSEYQGTRWIKDIADVLVGAHLFDYFAVVEITKKLVVARHRILYGHGSMVCYLSGAGARVEPVISGDFKELVVKLGEDETVFSKYEDYINVLSKDIESIVKEWKQDIAQRAAEKVAAGQ